jgi:branched-chain amino acid transport system ATP-binding protein
MLEVNSLTVSYGEIAALRGVTLAVEEGEIVTLIGGNGAGKSTTLRAISGLLRPKGGTILLDGEAISGLAPDRIVSLGVAHVPEGRRVFPQLSLEDNLRVGAHLRRDAGVRSDLERVYAMFPHLKDRRRQLAESLSGGEQQMLALGRAIMSRPRVLLLDEPSLGLAPTVVEDVARAILSFRKQGITVLLVEQNARVALAISDRGYVIENGRTVLSNTAALLKSDPKVVASYLGGAPTGDARHLQPHSGMMEKLDLSLNILASGERP